IYNPVERPDASFSATYYGGEKEEWDAINSGAATDGTMDSWNTLVSLSNAVGSAGTEAARTAAYMKVLGLNANGTDNLAFDNYLDATNYVDYLMTNFYGGNQDWPHRNWYASRRNGPETQGFVFHNWDFETSLGLTAGVTTNVLGASVGAAEPYNQLKASLEFRVLFGDRVHRAFFNSGPLATQNSVARYQEIVQELQQAIVAESARWGDMQTGTPPYTKAQWQSEITNVTNFLLNRNSIFLNQLRAAGLYSTVVAPSFSQHGGLVSSGFDLTVTAPAGAIWYTLDGSDPRMIGGGVGSTAIAYTGSPIDVATGLTVRARVLNGGVWSALNEATFAVAAPADASNLRIVEVHYNPASQAGMADAQTLEFIELLNPSGQTVSLDGVQIAQFANSPYAFANGLMLAPGERIVVARNPSVIQSLYGAGINVAAAGYAEDNLSNGGEQITLLGPTGLTLQDVIFDDAGLWPLAADGGGKSIEIINPLGAASDPTNWRASHYRGGSPGTSGVAPALAGDFDGDGDADGSDFLRWQRGLGTPALTGSATVGDADGDRDVDGSDLVLWRINFGASFTATAMTQAASAPPTEADLVSLAQRMVDQEAPEQPIRVQGRKHLSPTAPVALSPMAHPQPAKGLPTLEESEGVLGENPNDPAVVEAIDAALEGLTKSELQAHLG
ncbi:MAG: lamin tail domain-containing protein, partial [Pirellulales bacterium]|nr:lamin tail domain-containing protein [Pirellulales bacterium]